LRSYNTELSASQTLPEWTTIYRTDEPPAYWLVLGNILKNWPRDLSVIEIGAGAGDVLALLLLLGFSDAHGIERDVALAQDANRKLEHFYGLRDRVLTGSYPLPLKKTPDIIIQINCVYYEGLVSREEYLARQREWMFFNGVPRLHALEMLDLSYISPRFPEFVHVSERDVNSTFSDCTVSSYLTYKHPRNASTKRLYMIEPLERK